MVIEQFPRVALLLKHLPPHVPILVGNWAKSKLLDTLLTLSGAPRARFVAMAGEGTYYRARKLYAVANRGGEPSCMNDANKW